VKDIFGQELVIGDTVAFNPPYYKGMITGTVLSFTPKGIQVVYSDPIFRAEDRKKTTPQLAHNVVKANAFAKPGPLPLMLHINNELTYCTCQECIDWRQKLGEDVARHSLWQCRACNDTVAGFRRTV